MSQEEEQSMSQQMDETISKNNGNVNKEEETTGGDNNTQGFNVFIGGLKSEITADDIKEYFSKSGEVLSVLVKTNEGKPRGFGFVTFSCKEIADKVVATGPHTIKQISLETKLALPKTAYNKILIRGVDASLTEAAIRAHFETYGKVENYEHPFNKATNEPRAFCFITFEKEENVVKACEESNQVIGSKSVTVSKAHKPNNHKTGLVKPMGRGGSRNLARGKGPSYQQNRNSGPSFKGRGGFNPNNRQNFNRGGYHRQNTAYPNQNGAPQHNGYPQQNNGYPQQQNGYYKQNGYATQQNNAYPPQPNGYYQENNGYTQQPGGYYEQGGGYPEQNGGYSQNPNNFGAVRRGAPSRGRGFHPYGY